MTFFQRVFGGSKKDGSNVTSEQAIQRLTSIEDVLLKKQIYLEAEIETEKAKAVSLSKQGNKRAALNALKKKKTHEKALLQVDGTLTTLESQREALQNAKSNMEVFHAMRGAAAAMKNANGGIDADTVHELKDEIDDQLSLADEIATAFSSPRLGASDAFDEADLLKELDDLAEENDREELLRIGPLPDVPITTNNNKTKEKDNSERELQAWMNS